MSSDELKNYQPGQLPYKENPIHSQPNAQQYQAVAKQYGDALIAIKKDIERRKWAVDQACGLSGSENAIVPDVMELARNIHAFIVESAVEKAEAL